MKTSKK